jgi:hypothetical protein
MSHKYPPCKFQAARGIQVADITKIIDMPQLPECSDDEYDSGDDSYDLSNCGNSEGKPLLRLKRTESTLKQYSMRIGQANYSTYNGRTTYV